MNIISQNNKESHSHQKDKKSNKNKDEVISPIKKLNTRNYIQKEQPESKIKKKEINSPNKNEILKNRKKIVEQRNKKTKEIIEEKPLNRKSPRIKENNIQIIEDISKNKNNKQKKGKNKENKKSYINLKEEDEKEEKKSTPIRNLRKQPINIMKSAQKENHLNKTNEAKNNNRSQ